MAVTGHTTVTLNDRPFFGCYDCAPEANPQGVAIIRKGGLDGWDSTPPVDVQAANIPNGHGSFDTPGYFQGRVMTLSGWIEAPNPLQLEHMKSMVRSAIVSEKTATMSVDKSGLVLTMEVKLGGDVVVKDWESLPAGVWKANYEIPLFAPDPFKYGAVNQFSMASDGAYLDIYHRGDFTAYPRVVITGSAAGGYELAHPSGAVYQVAQPLVTGHPHEVDMRTGLLRVDGVVDMAGVTGASVWHVPPGAYHQMKVRPLTVGQTATAICYVTDTYA